MFRKKMFLKVSQILLEDTCDGVFFFNKAEDQGPAILLKRVSEFCEILKNTYFVEHLWTTILDIENMVT